MNHFPRIRGDGPSGCKKLSLEWTFSPYSRGWSGPQRQKRQGPHHFPRIRGDGPTSIEGVAVEKAFSPYSRGWSRPHNGHGITHRIFPVFAGMVPPTRRRTPTRRHFPRICGDGPSFINAEPEWSVFSPYLRG